VNAIRAGLRRSIISTVRVDSQSEKELYSKQRPGGGLYIHTTSIVTCDD
jgi:hypothetical protein